MKLLVALVFAVALQAQAQAQAQDIPEWFAESFLDLREDLMEAAGDGKRLMVYFGQDGCPYCKQLMSTTMRDPEIVAKTRRHFVALAINILGSREVTWTDGRKMSEKDFAAMLKVHATPTLIFFDEKGGIALRLTGYLPPAQFERRLDAAFPGRSGRGRFFVSSR